MNIKWTTAAALLCVGIGGAPLGAQDSKPATESKPAATKIKVGDTVDGAVKLKNIDGVETSFADLRGKTVAIVFYSIECPWMTAAEPKLKTLHQEWAGKNVVFLAVDSNKGEIGKDPYAGGAKPKESYSDIRAHLKAKEVAFTVYADHGNTFADLMQAGTTPHCFVVDQAGVLRYSGALDDDGRGQKGDATVRYFKDAVEATMKGEKPKNETTKPYG
jgi:hypothetical protein